MLGELLVRLRLCVRALSRCLTVLGFPALIRAATSAPEVIAPGACAVDPQAAGDTEIAGRVAADVVHAWRLAVVGVDLDESALAGFGFGVPDVASTGHHSLLTVSPPIFTMCNPPSWRGRSTPSACHSSLVSK